MTHRWWSKTKSSSLSPSIPKMICNTASMLKVIRIMPRVLPQRNQRRKLASLKSQSIRIVRGRSLQAKSRRWVRRERTERQVERMRQTTTWEAPVDKEMRVSVLSRTTTRIWAIILGPSWPLETLVTPVLVALKKSINLVTRSRELPRP